MFLGMDNKWKQKARAIDHLDDFYGYNNSKQKQKMSVFQEKNRNKGKWVLHILKEICEHHPAYIQKKKSPHDDFSKNIVR